MLLRSLTFGLDRLGLRKIVAVAATLYYRFRPGSKRRFSVTSEGHWVNRQKEATIVSPTIHTASFVAVEANALDLWTWQYRPTLGDIVIDVGAGVGEETLVFSKLIGNKGLVVSIEANPSTFASLKESVARTGATNVRPVQLAVTGVDALTKISNTTDHVANSLFIHASSVEVEGRSLGSLVQELGLAKVALLKMNIEGAERMAVQGMADVADRIQHVVVSCHDFIADESGADDFRTFDEVRRTLERLGFETSVRPDDPRPWVRYYLYGRNISQTAAKSTNSATQRQ
jgi:FkbM family methyltransferase